MPRRGPRAGSGSSGGLSAKPTTERERVSHEMASKQSSGPRIMRYDPARRDMWLHDFRAKVRRESLFGEQVLAGVHQPPAEMQRLDESVGAEPFRVERLAHSTLQLEGSSSESTASEEDGWVW